MKLVYILILFLSITLIGLKDSYAGLYLGYNTNYTISYISDESVISADKMKYSGLGHEFELGWALGMSGVRIIPLISLVQVNLKPGSNDDMLTLTMLSDKKYKMGRLSYAIRFDLGSAIYLKVGGAIYSLTQSPAPSDNYHINGNGYFAEGGLVFNLVPYASFILGARYELGTYEKYRTKTSGNPLDNKVKQNNMTGVFGISLRI